MKPRKKLELFLTQIFVESGDFVIWIDMYFPQVRAELPQGPSLVVIAHKLYSYLEAEYGTLPLSFWDALRESRGQRRAEIDVLQSLFTPSCPSPQGQIDKPPQEGSDANQENSADDSMVLRPLPEIFVEGPRLDILKLIDSCRERNPISAYLNTEFKYLSQGSTNNVKRRLCLEISSAIIITSAPVVYIDENRLTSSWILPQQQSVELSYFPQGVGRKNTSAFALRVVRASDDLIDVLLITNVLTGASLTLRFKKRGIAS